MTTETKLAVLRYLKKWYELGYKILKNTYDKELSKMFNEAMADAE